ncbi:MAG TPA: proline/glycine betaine ABC transporter permease [Epulopiscium sp.]|nr:proline/glycine betaine ABC transporter permease [Candidatus Epulonipiscium sp.]
MSNFPDIIRFNIGVYIDAIVDWLVTNGEAVFAAITKGTLGFLLAIQSFIMWVPWYIFILAVILLGMYVSTWKSGVIYGAMLFAIGGMGLWEEMAITLAIVITSVLISVFIGVPLGILAAYSKRASVFINPLLDAMQTMPSFVYLIPAVMFFGLGMVPAVFATIIYATPPAIRLTTLAIRGVSKEMLEAAHSFGSPPWKILLQVELPQAFPTIMTGINQTTMMAMAMVVTSSMIGAKGLGLNVLTSINRLDIAMGFEAGISIVFLAVIIDRLTQGVANKFNYHNESKE